MRSYIFTKTEKRAIAQFFEGNLTGSDPNVAKVKHRMNRYSELRSDVELYLKLERRLKQSSSTR